MVVAGLIVSAVAVPLGVAGWRIARRWGTALLPRWQRWRVPWAGFEVVAAFLLLNAVVPGLVFAALAQGGFFTAVYGPDFPPSPPTPVPSLEASAAVAGGPAALTAKGRATELNVVRGLWAGVLSLPAQLGLLFFARNLLYPGWRSPTTRRGIPSQITLGVLGWAVLTPVALGVNALVAWAFAELGWSTEGHPLTTLSQTRPAIDQVLFLLQACLAAPVVEEVLFRGVLLPWLLGSRWRVWPVLGVAAATAAYLSADGRNAFTNLDRGPVLFALLLAAGWALLAGVLRKRRTAGAVYASAALFAVVHSSVWPTPIPLFLLGLGLGWLAVRTRGVVAPAVAHGLFNAVSAVFVLRGG